MPASRWLAPLLLFTSTVALADDKKDALGDPLPDGAKFRLGTGTARNTSYTTPKDQAVRLGVFTPAGEHIVGTQKDGKLIFVDPTTWTITRTVVAGVDANELPLSVASVSADGKRVAVVGAKTVVVLNTEDGKLLARAPREVVATANQVALSADGKRLAVGPGRFAADLEKLRVPASVLVWDVDANKQLASVEPAHNISATPTLSPDGKRLVTWHSIKTKAGGAGGVKKAAPKEDAPEAARALQFWDVGTGKEIAKAWLGQGAAPVAVAFSPDGTLVAASTGDGTVQLLNAANGEEKATLFGRIGQGHQLTFSRDGKTLAAIADDEAVQMWSVADGRLRSTIESPFTARTNTARALTFVDDARVRVWHASGATHAVWSAPPEKKLEAPTGHTAAVVSIAAHGKEWVTVTSNGAVIRWDAATGKQLGALHLDPPERKSALTTRGLSAVHLSQDGNWAVGDLTSEGQCVYSLQTGLQQFALGTGRVSVLNTTPRTSFSADGTKVLTVTGGLQEVNRVTLWDVAATKRTRTFDLPAEYIRANVSALSPDGTVAVTVGLNRKGAQPGYAVTSWDIAAGKKLGEVAVEGPIGVNWQVVAIDNTASIVAPPTDAVVIVDYKAGIKPRELAAPDRAPVAPVVSPDGKTVAVLINRTEKHVAGVMLYDVATGKLKKTFTGIGGKPTAVAFSGDGTSLLTGSDDTTILVWDLTKP